MNANVSRSDRRTAIGELQTWLEPLIRWRFSVSNVHYGIAAEGVEEIQAGALKSLEDPRWMDREVVATAIR